MEMVKIEKSKNLPQRQYFEKINWVLLAMAQDNVRKNISKTICVRDGFAMATDGRRLHMYDQYKSNNFASFMLPDGLYELETKTKTALYFRQKDAGEAPFPDTDKVFFYRPSNGIPPFNNMHTSHSYGRFLKHIYCNTELEIDEAFLRDAFIRDANLKFERAGSDAFCALVFSDGERLAMIMPLIP